MLNENKNILEIYDSVSEDVKYVSNSIIRLRVLATLFEKPQNMKSLTEVTKLSYSSISSTLHGLELKNLVYRESNKYYLSNSLKILMKTILEVKDVVNALEKFFNIIHDHIVDMIPNQSIVELYLMKDANLLESDGLDAYKIYNFIEEILIGAKNVMCIFPFFHIDFNQILNDSYKKGNNVEIIVSREVFEIYEEKSEVKYLSSFDAKNNFLLIVSEKIMILGLFRKDGQFDQNRLLVSKSEDSIKWGKNLFKYSKKKR